MNYQSNYETAQTYLQAGLRERAEEILLSTLKEIPANDKIQKNTIYLKILANLAQLRLEDKQLKQAKDLIEEGLGILSTHIDLLFLRCLYEWETMQYDDMFISLVGFINSLDEEQSRNQYSIFSSKETIQQVFSTLLPIAYKNATSRKEVRVVIQQMKASTNNPIIRALDQTMNHIEASIG